MEYPGRACPHCSKPPEHPPQPFVPALRGEVRLDRVRVCPQAKRLEVVVVVVGIPSAAAKRRCVVRSFSGMSSRRDCRVSTSSPFRPLFPLRSVPMYAVGSPLSTRSSCYRHILLMVSQWHPYFSAASCNEPCRRTPSLMLAKRWRTTSSLCEMLKLLRFWP